MRFDNYFKFIYSFKPKMPSYGEYLIKFNLLDTNTVFRMYSKIANNNYYGDCLEEPHSKIKCYGPERSNYNFIEETSFDINRIYVFDTLDDMNRDYIGKCTGIKREKLLHLKYKHDKLKGEI